MSMKGILFRFAAALAMALAQAIRVAEAVVAPFLRLWRLARLKASVDGVVPVTTQFDGAVETDDPVRIEIGEHCRFGRRVYLETSGSGRIQLGDNVRINAGTFIVAYAEISIGRDSLIGEYVSIRDADHGVAGEGIIREQPHTASPIRIEDGAWIGRGAVVLKGVTIGAGAVVAANSVVTRDVRPMAIVAGAPAREIRQRGATRAEPRASANPPGPQQG